MHTSKYEVLTANENKKKQQERNIHQKCIFVIFEKKKKKFTVVACSNEFCWIGTFHLVFVWLVLSTLTAYKQRKNFDPNKI